MPEPAIPQPDCLLVRLAGELDVLTVPAAKAQLRRALEGESRPLVIDLSDVPFVDSAGLSLLLFSARQCRGRQERVALAGLNGRVRQTLSVTGLLHLFAVYPTPTEAVEAMVATQNGS
jgi:anti-sigma B factor antagonist